MEHGQDMDPQELQTAESADGLPAEPEPASGALARARESYAGVTLPQKGWLECAKPADVFAESEITGAYIRPEAIELREGIIRGVQILAPLIVLSIIVFTSGDWTLVQRLVTPRAGETPPNQQPPESILITEELAPIRLELEEINEAIEGERWGEAASLMERLLYNPGALILLKEKPGRFLTFRTKLLQAYQSAGQNAKAEKIYSYIVDSYRSQGRTPPFEVYKSGLYAVYAKDAEGQKGDTFSVIDAEKLQRILNEMQRDYGKKMDDPSIRFICANALLTLIEQAVMDDAKRRRLWGEFESQLKYVAAHEPDSRRSLNLQLRKWIYVENLSTVPVPGYNEDLEIGPYKYTEAYAEAKQEEIRKRIQESSQ